MSKREQIWLWAHSLDCPVDAPMVRKQFGMGSQSASHALKALRDSGCLVLLEQVDMWHGPMNRYLPTDKKPAGSGNYCHKGVRVALSGHRITVDEGRRVRKARIYAPKKTRRFECAPVIRL